MPVLDKLFDVVLTEPDRLDPRAELRSTVIEDRQLAAWDRALAHPTDVTVINTSGAGGITALAGRSFEHVTVRAVQTAVRDPGDLVGNIARIAAAARELDSEITVVVDIPDGFGWQDAVSAAEAEGLTAVADRTALAKISAFIEADLPFSVDGVDSADDLIGLVTAIDSLIDEPDVAAATAQLTDDHDQQWSTIASWDDIRADRERRRLRTVRTTAWPTIVTELAQRRTTI